MRGKSATIRTIGTHTEMPGPMVMREPLFIASKHEMPEREPRSRSSSHCRISMHAVDRSLSPGTHAHLVHDDLSHEYGGDLCLALPHWRCLRWRWRQRQSRGRRNGQGRGTLASRLRRSIIIIKGVGSDLACTSAHGGRGVHGMCARGGALRYLPKVKQSKSCAHTQLE